MSVKGTATKQQMIEADQLVTGYAPQEEQMIKPNGHDSPIHREEEGDGMAVKRVPDEQHDESREVLDKILALTLANLSKPAEIVSQAPAAQSLAARTGIISIIVTVLLAFVANLGLGLYNWGIQRAQLDQQIRNQEKTDHKLETLKDLFLLDIGKRSQMERDKMSNTEKSKIDDLMKEDSR